MAKTQQERIFFGLKLRQLRLGKGWNFDELGRMSGISASYLNEMEKGKKMPGAENLQKLATVLGVPPEELLSEELPKMLQPLSGLLKSNFLNELPLELFGIDLQQVVEIIARAPDRVGAFISALLEIARNYSLREENFYFAALRAYQELQMNYFEDIETAADNFLINNNLDTNNIPEYDALVEILKTKYNCKVDPNGIARYPELQYVRAVFIPSRKRLLLNGKLSQQQKTFQVAKELGFAVLGLKERPYASNSFKINSFEQVLNNFKAAYFAVAILVNRSLFVNDLRIFFDQPTWNPQMLGEMVQKYRANPEIVFQRFNVLSREFDLHKVFFQRIVHDLAADHFQMDKELHLNRRHEPHASGLDEHYCRRWIALDLLKKIQDAPRLDTTSTTQQVVFGVQRAFFKNSGEEYLCIAAAKSSYPAVGRHVSIVLGIQIDAITPNIIRFTDDPKVPSQVVNVTCERCEVVDCKERAAPPLVLEKREQQRAIHAAISKLTGK